MKKSSIEESIIVNITGVICLNINNRFFPDNNWNDFIIILLNWWIKDIITNKHINNNYFFMDGSFYFRIESNSVIFLYQNNTIIDQAQLIAEEFINQIYITTKELIQYIDENKLSSEDIIQLKQNYIAFNNLYNLSS